ncbi:natural cytotoxicity triggering receptor 1-like isoform X3 [Octodon degus]|uniref:Natural cytotoxicity triggering receptor 1 n=1 Tax=Octodon degus TaxID=10160 RepID=A0A6P6DUN5_OCTDE|nr:natural cytotoxicity triggering receptor 1-like isoform X3 [Octodon degus]
MWPVLAALLCLGLCWSQGVSTRKRMPKPTVPRCKADILIPTMTSRTAGRYSCSYRSGGRWSEPSDGLDLVVTGMYDTPTLQVHPGPEVTLGESVTLYCHLETATSMFFLLKEGRSSHVREGWGPVQAEFPLGPVTAAHQGTYRCFGSYNSHSWSFPSEPVELVVTGDGNTSFSLLDPTSPAAAADAWEPCAMNTESGAQKDPVLWDFTTQNLLRLGLALLVLVALVLLLVEDCKSRKRVRVRAHGATSREHRGRRGRRVPTGTGGLA